MSAAAVLYGTVPDHFKNGSGDGDGSGSGSGSGYGYGYGYGYGSGSGDGDGSGYGYGYGSGDGSGSGYGSGDGSGSGYGYGYGYGYGSGSGYGSKEYWIATIPGFVAKLSAAIQARYSALVSDGCTVAFWRSNSKGEACNGGSNAPVSAGTVETIRGPLEICTCNGLHATTIPPKWKGDRVWLVALKGEVQWSDDKCAALSREVIAEITPCP